MSEFERAEQVKAERPQAKSQGWVVEVEGSPFPYYVRLLLCTPYGPVEALELDVPARAAERIGRGLLFWPEDVAEAEWLGPAGFVRLRWSQPYLEVSWFADGEMFEIAVRLDWEAQRVLGGALLRALEESEGGGE